MAKKKEFKGIGDVFKTLSDTLKVDDTKNVIEWIEKHNIKTEDGFPIVFDERKFLIDILNDTAQKRAIMASAQVG